MKSIALCGFVALAGCSKAQEYQRSKNVSEPRFQLNRLAKDAKVAYITNAQFPKGKAVTLPESAGAACCEGGNGGKCKPSMAWANDPVWKELDFQIDEPTFFRYSYESVDGQSFTATAVGDLDCDGTTITYTLTGTAKDGGPSTTLTEPTNSD